METNQVVSCKCYGRLGNNLFQMAAAIGYAKKYGAKFVAPHAYGDPTYAAHFESLPKANLPQDAFGCVYKEPHHHYAEIPELDSPLLDGYFQSEKYFAHAADEVRDLFWKCSKFDPGMFSEFVSVHVRRGDYLQFSHQFPPMPLEYYQKAMAMFEDGAKFMVFSDDIEWCKQNFKGDQIAFIEDNNHPVVDLFLMATCRHHIISNSSFSWWGAWLNPDPQKWVIAPKTWFGPAMAHLDTKDVVPSNWWKI